MAVRCEWFARLMGPFVIENKQHPAIKLPTRKGTEILAILCLQLGKSVRKEALAEEFWPENEEELQAQSLRQCIASIQKTLGEDGVLLSTRGFVEVSPDKVTTDVVLFDELVRRARTSERDERIDLLDQAIQLVRGPVLEGIDRSWVIAEQMRIEEAYAQAVTELMGLYLDQGEPRAAVSLGREVLAISPLREDVQAMLIRAYGQAGLVNEAIRQYEEFERIVDETWGESPGQLVISALDSLPGTTPPPQKVSKGVTVDQTPRSGANSDFLVGRESQLEHIQSLLLPKSATKLVTLVGIGGVGKSALAREAVERLAPTYDNRVITCSLSGERSEAQLVASVRRAMGASPDRIESQDASISDLVNPEPTLLLLDRMEDSGTAASAVLRWLKDSPSLVILATSRLPLNVRGEILVHLGPLDVPEAGASFADVRQSGSVQLLESTATRVNPSFALDTDNAAAVAEICRSVEGHPLAIVTVASRLRTMSAPELIASVSGSASFTRLKIVTPARDEHVVADIVQWTIAHLTPAAQMALPIVNEVEGTWDAETLNALLPDGDAGALLEEYVLASLARRVGCGYRLFDVVRSQIKQASTCDVREQAWGQHASYFASIAIHSMSSVLSKGLPEDVERIEGMMPDFRAVLDRVREVPDLLPDALKVGGGLVGYANARGYSREWGNRLQILLEQALEVPDNDVFHLGRALIGAGHIAIYVGDLEKAEEYYQLALSVAREAKHPVMIAGSLNALAILFIDLDKVELAIKCCDEGLQVFPAGGPEALRLSLRGNIARAIRLLGDYEASKSEFLLALTEAVRLEMTGLAMRLQLDLARIALDMEHPSEVTSYLEKIRIEAQLDTELASEVQVIDGQVLHAKGDYQAALVAYKGALGLMHRLSKTPRLIETTALAIVSLVQLGRLEEAMNLVGCVGLSSEPPLHGMSPAQRELVLPALTELLTVYDDDAWALRRINNGGRNPCEFICD